ncbi:MAG: hypothetical protein RLZZ565_1509 [Planctomycetota bacterium]
MNDAPSACPSPAVCSWSLRPREATDLAAMVRQTGGDSIQLALMPLLDGGPWANAASVLAKESISITSGMVAMD